MQFQIDSVSEFLNWWQENNRVITLKDYVEK